MPCDLSQMSRNSCKALTGGIRGNAFVQRSSNCCERRKGVVHFSTVLRIELRLFLEIQGSKISPVVESQVTSHFQRQFLLKLGLDERRSLSCVDPAQGLTGCWDEFTQLRPTSQVIFVHLTSPGSLTRFHLTASPPLVKRSVENWIKQNLCEQCASESASCATTLK